MIRPSTKMFMLSVALWCLATISYVNTTGGFLPETLASMALPPVFIICGVMMAAFGIICRFAEKLVPHYRKFRISALFAHMRLPVR